MKYFVLILIMVALPQESSAQEEYKIPHIDTIKANNTKAIHLRKNFESLQEEINSLREQIKDVRKESRGYQPVPSESIKLELATERTITHHLSPNIPKGAIEVLVYVSFISAGEKVHDATATFRFYVREKEVELSFYLATVIKQQPVWSFNSDNFWLPVTSDRNIYIEKDGPNFENKNTAAYMQILGYRK